MRVVTITLFCLALLGTAPALQAQDWVLKTPEAVLEANVKATGGAEAWNKIKTVRREGALEVDFIQGRKGHHHRSCPERCFHRAQVFQDTPR